MSSPKRPVLGVRRRATALFGVLLLFNAAAWLWAFAAFHGHPVLLGTAFLAYTFGLRHAVDADHIAAIDNVTRKLMHQGQRPVSVGCYFSLGHSTVVFALSLAVAVASVTIKDHFASWAGVAGTLGTCISAAFLLGIACANAIVLRSVYRTFVHVKRGGQYSDEDLDILLSSNGFLSRVFRSVFRIVDRSPQMYLVGFLFGLGFDTATEVGLLGISAKSASSGISFWSMLIFPALFTAGMTLIDTADGVVMLGAYHWAFVKPLRKLYYNLVMTSISIVVAVFISGVELLGVMGGRWRPQGVAWDAIAALNGHFGIVGFSVIGLCVLTWGLSVALSNLKD
ncbi:MAG TPA: HoxN/HupN/NixA family nickel/cobalt transporter [Opitutaceae bacterium]|jgi:high-affinity nickel-transport protein|nr:HoxN/HupN/NixA family nickel/cobalt transporter [Opitutaceae bacterium]